jgi:hypothetical protein
VSVTYHKAPDMRARELAAWEAILVYTRERPALHWLNTNAWLVLELCDGRTLEETQAAFAEVKGGDPGSAQVAEACLRSLEQKGIVHTHPY